MGIELGALERGKYYMHRKYGRCLYITVHPEDGACVIMEWYNEEEDEFSLIYTEHMYLEPYEADG